MLADKDDDGFGKGDFLDIIDDVINEPLSGGGPNSDDVLNELKTSICIKTYFSYISNKKIYFKNLIFDKILENKFLLDSNINNKNINIFYILRYLHNNFF